MGLSKPLSELASRSAGSFAQAPGERSAATRFGGTDHGSDRLADELERWGAITEEEIEASGEVPGGDAEDQLALGLDRWGAVSEEEIEASGEIPGGEAVAVPAPWGVVSEDEVEASGQVAAAVSGQARTNANQEVLASHSFGHVGRTDLVNMVNVQSGNWVVDRADVGLTAVGRPLEISRVYNSLNHSKRSLWANAESRPFGEGWSTNFDLTLMRIRGKTPAGDRFRLTLADGRVDVLVPERPPGVSLVNDDNTFWGPGRTGDVLVVAPSGTIRVSHRDGSSDHFEPRPGGTAVPGAEVFRLTKLEDRHGNETTFTYEQGELRTIRDEASGRAITLAWANGLLTSAEVPSPTGSGTSRWTYRYGTVDNKTVLIRACDSRPLVGGVPFCESYGWRAPGTSGLQKCGSHAIGANVQLCAVYDMQGRLVEDVTYDGAKVIKHRYHPDAGVAHETTFTRRVGPTVDVRLPTATAPNQVTTYTYDAYPHQDRLKSVEEPAVEGGRPKTTYEYLPNTGALGDVKVTTGSGDSIARRHTIFFSGQV